MRIILSRKGFDTGAGGLPSPIMPDGTLLSMPIPSDYDNMRFDEFAWQGMTYHEILSQLRPNRAYTTCHLDPDIRPDVRASQVSGWKPAFGQIGSSQGVLRNNGIGENDLFLFFGLFRQTEWVHHGCLQFQQGATSKQVVFGYLQVQKVITNPVEIKRYPWHPHACASRLMDATNALYIPSEMLTFDPSRPGCGVLDNRPDRILTKQGEKPATWVQRPFYSPESVSGIRKNSAKKDGLYYAGQWQELVLRESEEANQWARSIIS